MSTVQTENTIILEMGTASKDDVTDLRYGEGKLFRKIADSLEKLQKTGEVGENIQPIVIILKKKKDKDW